MWLAEVRVCKIRSLLLTYLVMWLTSANGGINQCAMMPHPSISLMDNGALGSCYPSLRRTLCPQHTSNWNEKGHGTKPWYWTPANRPMCENKCFLSHWSVGIAIGKLSNVDFHGESSSWWKDHSLRSFFFLNWCNLKNSFISRGSPDNHHADLSQNNVLQALCSKACLNRIRVLTKG